MSWHCSQVLAAEFLAANFWGSEPSAPSKSTRTPETSSSPDRTMGHWNPSRFGMTYGRLQAKSGEALLTWYLADFRARISQSQEEAPACPAPDPVSGLKCSESFAKWNRDSSSWRTPQLLLDVDSTLFSGVWPRWGMMRAGECWALITPAHLTNGTGYGSWHTPVADDSVDRAVGKYNSRGEPQLSAQVLLWPTPRASANENRQTKPTPSQLAGEHGMNLSTAVNMPERWPTPLATDGEKGGPNNRGGKGDLRLPSAVCLWPTPTVNGDYNKKGASPNSGDGLATRVAMLPTPTAQGASNNGGPSQSNRNTPPLNAVAGGRLNPDWVELLMGWPTGWTDVEKPLDWDGTIPVWGDGWEQGVPRVTNRVSCRVSRLRCLGNGQVPAVVALAWRILNERR